MYNGHERKRFLLRMYAVYWSNISRAEDSAWKMFASYIALFAGLSLAYPIISVTGFLLLFIIFSFMSIAVALRANLWYVRNLGLISNLEQEFLAKQNYGITVPQFFLEKVGFLNREVWWIHIVTYSSICAAVILLLYPQIKVFDHQWIIGIFLIESIVSCLFYGYFWYEDYKKYREQAPGRYPEMKK